MKYIVYLTTNLVNNKIYIGMHKTENPYIFDNYIGGGIYINEPSTYERSKTIFQRAVKKYGPKNFKRKIIAIFDTVEEASYLEEQIVNEKFLARPDVYNMVIGGLGGDRGFNAKKCYQYDLNGIYLNKFNSIQEAALSVKRERITISRAIINKIKAANYYWSYEKTDKLNLKLYKTIDNKIPIFQYSKTGEYDCCYESINDAARCNNTSKNQIIKYAKLGILLNDKYFSLEFETNFSQAKYKYIYNTPIYIYSIKGEFIRESKNLNELKKELNTRKDLFKYIKLNKIFEDKYQFSVEKVPSMPNRSIKKPTKRKIAQCDLNGNIIKIFNTISECVKIYGAGVKHCLSGRNHQSKGYTYKYLDNLKIQSNLIRNNKLI